MRQIILLLTSVLWTVNITAQSFSGGAGTEVSPYLISSKADMIALANAVDGETNYYGKYFLLTTDLTGTNAVNTTVGSCQGINGAVDNRAFMGIFNGGGHVIEMNSTTGGVFGYINGANIQNLGVKGTISVSVSEGVAYVGGICNYGYGTISYCYNSASISSYTSGVQTHALSGGISGDNGTISNCYNTGTVSAETTSLYSYAYSTGVSYNGTISNCYNVGNISAATADVQNSYPLACGISIYGNSVNCFAANASITTKRGGTNYYGINRIGNGTINSCYALTTMSINGSTVSSINANSANGANATMANFQSQSWIQTNLGWDFSTVWKMSSSGSGLPILRSQSSPTLTVSPENLIFAADGETKPISVTSDTVWIVYSDVTWATVSVSSGFGNGTVNVTCLPNTSMSSRTATITFSDGTTTKNVAITQNGVILSVDPSSLSFPSNGGYENFTVYSNINWIASCDASWISLYSASGSDTSNISVYCSVNTTVNTRTATITISGGGLTKYVYITQNGVDPELTVSPSSLSFAYNGNQQSFSVYSNTSWTVSENTTWLTVTPMSGNDNGTVYVNCFTNTEAASRSATITVYGSNITRYITVYQSGAPTYNISASVAGSGGSISPSGSVSVVQGNNQTFYFYPYTGYEINEVVVDGSVNYSAANNGFYTFTNVYSNHSISVSFRLKTFTITASAGQGGSISPSGTATVNYGSSKTYTFQANFGYAVNQVYIDGYEYNPAVAAGHYTFTNITSNHSITVYFKQVCIPNLFVLVWGEVLTVINNPSHNGGLTFTKYQWQKNGVDIPGATDGQYSIYDDPDSSTALYSVRLTTNDGRIIQACQVQASAAVRHNTVNVFPNPTESKITIESDSVHEGDRIVVHSSTGMIVKQFSASGNNSSIDISSLPKGMYIIRINGEAVKILKNR
jgi:hypothetical protein